MGNRGGIRMVLKFMGRVGGSEMGEFMVGGKDKNSKIGAMWGKLFPPLFGFVDVPIRGWRIAGNRTKWEKGLIKNYMSGYNDFSI